MTINDNRIGISDRNRRVIRYPTRYANNEFWKRDAVPHPTTVYFGPGKRFFYILPINMPYLNDKIRAAFEAIVAGDTDVEQDTRAAFSHQLEHDEAASINSTAAVRKDPIGVGVTSIDNGRKRYDPIIVKKAQKT